MSENDAYRDDPEQFGQNAGQGNEGQGRNNRSEQPTTNTTVVAESVDWKDGEGPLGEASPLHERQTHDGQAAPEKQPRPDEPVESRSDDPGQGSYGGFKNE